MEKTLPCYPGTFPLQVPVKIPEKKALNRTIEKKGTYKIKSGITYIKIQDNREYTIHQSCWKIVEIRDNTQYPLIHSRTNTREGEESRDLRSPGLDKKRPGDTPTIQEQKRMGPTLFHRRVLASTNSGWSTAEENDPLCKGVPLSRSHGKEKTRDENPVDQGGKNRNGIIACQRGDTPRG